MTFIRESLVQMLQLPRLRAPIPLIGIGAQKNYTTRGAVELHFRARTNQKFALTVIAYILPQLTGQIPAKSIAHENWQHLEGLTLADPDYVKFGQIDIILGADVYGSLLRGGLRQGPSEAPIA